MTGPILNDSPDEAVGNDTNSLAAMLLFSFSIFHLARPAATRLATFWSVMAWEVAQALRKTMSPAAFVVTSSHQLARMASSLLRSGT